MRESLYIDGFWRPATGGGLLEVVNPANGEVIHHVAAGDSSDIDHAVGAARRALAGPWGKTTGRERASTIRAIGREILARVDELSRLEVLDNGKPLPEARWDVEDAAGCFDYYADLAEALDARQGEAIAVPHDGFRSTVLYEPIGVVGQIIPWNYPLLMAAWKVAPALAAGCTCVLKPSELTPLTALELAAISHECGLPPGVLNVVTGDGKAGAALSSHPGTDKTAFTGSVPTGINVMHAGAESIKPVTLELGGKSPILVFSDVDVDAAVEWIMFGVFWNQGQVCSATSRLLVHDAIAPKLLARLAEEARKITIGDGMAPGVLLGPLISRAQLEKVSSFVTRATAAGATLLCGGRRPPSLDRHGYYFEPTILTDISEDAEIWTEEVFGPVLAVRTFSDEDEAVAAANNSVFGLAAAILSPDEDRCRRVSRRLRAGIIWVNCSQPTFTQAPWGGMKRSGIGRELGRWGLEAYLAVKQVTSYVSTQPWGWYLKT